MSIDLTASDCSEKIEQLGFLYLVSSLIFKVFYILVYSHVFVFTAFVVFMICFSFNLISFFITSIL